MNSIRNYIIVDDDPFNNMLCRMQLEITMGEVDIQTFEIPEEALAFIEGEFCKELKPAVLFLDINMPTITGWEFMEQYEKFSATVKEQISIYLLSSSVDSRDKEKAEHNKFIKGFMSKPLQSEQILSIADNNAAIG
jgi:CheY-like chemotaxis protein